VSLSWDASSGDPLVAGFKVYSGTASGVYTQSHDVGNTTTATESNLQDGVTYYFAVAAYDMLGAESPISGEVAYEDGSVVSGTTTTNGTSGTSGTDGNSGSNNPSTLVATDQTVILLSASSVVINVLAAISSGSDAVSQITQPRHGSAVINADNTITYTKAKYFPGHDLFTYTLSDGNGDTSTASITITDRGTLNSLISNSVPNIDNTGLLQLELTGKGKFIGRVSLGSYTGALSGAFDPDGDATVIVNRKDEPAITLVLNLDPVTGALSGSLSTETDGSSAVAGSMAPTYSGTNAAPQAGTYTLLIPPDPIPTPGTDIPQGVGYCRLVVSSKGTVRLAGRLADSTSVGVSAYIAPDGSFPVYARLYGGKGFLYGVLKFETVTISGSESDLDGVLQWQKPASKNQNAMFPAGFATTSGAIGSAYLATRNLKKAESHLDAEDYEGTVSLANGDLSAPIDDQVALVGPGLFRELTAKDPLVIRVDTNTGIFTGAFLDPATNSVRRLRGAVFQKRALAAGSFINHSTSGSVVLANSTLATP